MCLLGRNGAGKTTTIKTIMGLARASSGGIEFAGSNLVGLQPHEIARLGVGYVPDERLIFPDLTVRENLVATARAGAGPARWTLDRVFALFPGLAERRGSYGNQLSGGEQQMLAIGRALMINPKLLILDEATEGLAPLVRAEIWRVLETLKRDGQAILLIDKNVAALLRVADRHVIIERGRSVWTGTSAELSADRRSRERFLGV